MRTPYFDQLVAEIRGFDLGDDEPLRAELQARQRGLPESLNRDQRLLLVVLHHRADAPDHALAVLQWMNEHDEADAVSEFLRAHLLAAVHQIHPASDGLDRLESAALGPFGAIPRAHLLHARATLQRIRGDLHSAVRSMREGLELDPTDGARWLDMGRLWVELGRHEEAAQAFEHGLCEDENDSNAQYELATLALARAEPAEAAAMMRKALQQAPQLRQRALVDPRWRDARRDPDLACLLEPTGWDPRWLPEPPPWLADLAVDPLVEGLGVVWLSEPEALALGEELRRAHARGPAGTFSTAAALAHSQERLTGATPLAQGPILCSRDQLPAPMVWCVDRNRPEQLWLAPSPAYPPFLWLPAGTRSDDLARALVPFVPQPHPARLSLTQTARGFIGYRGQLAVPNPCTGDLEPADVGDLDRHFAVNPFMDAGLWGSCQREDPWPASIPAQADLQLKIAARELRVGAQACGRLWRISRRTRHSRSILSIEWHHGDILVADVRYRPAASDSVIIELNRRFDTDYPTDMPVDTVAALLGFRFDSTADIEATMVADPDSEDLAGLLLVWSALRYGDLTVLRRYRAYLDHPDRVVRSTLYNLLVAHNHESLLEEALVTERDADLRRQIEVLLDRGIAPIVPDHDIPGDDPDQEARCSAV